MGKIEQSFVGIILLMIIFSGVLLLQGEESQQGMSDYNLQTIKGYDYNKSQGINVDVFVNSSVDVDKEIFIVADHEESIYVVDTKGKLLREIRISSEERSVVINSVTLINDELWVFGDFISFVSDINNVLAFVLDPVTGEILQTIGHRNYVDTFGACQFQDEVMIYTINDDLSPPKLLTAYQDEKDQYWIIAEDAIEYLGRELEIVCDKEDMYVLSIGGLWRIDMKTWEQELIAYADFDQLQEVDLNKSRQVYVMANKNAATLSQIYEVKTDNDRILVFNFSGPGSMGIVGEQLVVMLNDSLYRFEEGELFFIRKMQKGILPSSLFVIDKKHIIYRDTLYNLESNESYFIGYYDPHPFFGVKSVSTN